MADQRAAKSGFALEAQAKLHSKWENAYAAQAMNWIAETLKDPSIMSDGSLDDCYNKLADGLVLAKLARWIDPSSVKESMVSKAPTMAFKKMELINLFLKCVEEGSRPLITKKDSFQSVDLYEKQNMYQVMVTIHAVGRGLQSQGRAGFGKAESKGETKQWTDEQLKAGQNIIGLQMGSNKGANQSGMNIGNTRHIVD